MSKKILDELPPGGGSGTSIPYIFVGAGTHEVKVVVDANNIVVESSDENNTLIQTMAIR